MSLKSIFNLVLAVGDMLASAQSQIVDAGQSKCIKLTTIALKNLSKYLPSGLAHGHGACPTFFMDPHVFKMSLKSFLHLVTAAGDMLAGAQSQIVAAGHAKCIKLTTSA